MGNLSISKPRTPAEPPVVDKPQLDDETAGDSGDEGDRSRSHVHQRNASVTPHASNDAYPPGSMYWQPNEEAVACAVCSKEFGLTRRRHHCRRCGGVVCDDCSPHKLPCTSLVGKPDDFLVRETPGSMQRACDKCAKEYNAQVASLTGGESASSAAEDSVSAPRPITIQDPLDLEEKVPLSTSSSFASFNVSKRDRGLYTSGWATVERKQTDLLVELKSLNDRVMRVARVLEHVTSQAATATPAKSAPPTTPTPAAAAAHVAPAAAATTEEKMEETPTEEQALVDLNGEDNDGQRRLRQLCRSLNIQGWKFRRAPHDYYDWTLERRRDYLQAVSTYQLCKTVIMKNTKCDKTDCVDPANSKYYAVIVQYKRRLNNEKLITLIRELGGRALPRKKYNFRLVSEEDSAVLTGYGHNAVTPIGMATNIPIVLSHHLLSIIDPAAPSHVLPSFWLGGGEVDVKWRVPSSEFVRALHPIVGDITYDDGAAIDGNEEEEAGDSKKVIARPATAAAATTTTSAAQSGKQSKTAAATAAAPADQHHSPAAAVAISNVTATESKNAATAAPESDPAVLAQQVRRAMQEEVQARRAVEAAAAKVHALYAAKLKQVSGAAAAAAGPAAVAPAGPAAPVQPPQPALPLVLPTVTRVPPSLQAWLTRVVPLIDWEGLSRFCMSLSITALRKHQPLPARATTRGGRARLASLLLGQALLAFPSWRHEAKHEEEKKGKEEQQLDLAQAQVYLVSGWCTGRFVNNWEKHWWIVLRPRNNNNSGATAPALHLDLTAAQFGVQPDADWITCAPVQCDDALPLRPDDSDAASWYVPAEEWVHADALHDHPSWLSTPLTQEEQSLVTVWEKLQAALSPSSSSATPSSSSSTPVSSAAPATEEVKQKEEATTAAKPAPEQEKSAPQAVAATAASEKKEEAVAKAPASPAKKGQNAAPAPQQQQPQAAAPKAAAGAGAAAKKKNKKKKGK